MPKARLDGWLLADQAWPVRLHCRGAKRSAAGMGCIADPLEGKRSAQASADRREGPMEARQGRDAQRFDAKHDSAARHRRETHRTKSKGNVWLTAIDSGRTVHESSSAT